LDVTWFGYSNYMKTTITDLNLILKAEKDLMEKAGKEISELERREWLDEIKCLETTLALVVEYKEREDSLNILG
jgi:hypothetical protein